MTIVVYDGSSIAVDRGATDGYTMWEMEKIWQVGDKILTGVGNISAVLSMKSWYIKGCKLNDFPSEQLLPDRWCEFIVVSRDGLQRYERSPNPIEHGKSKCAFGTGKDFAYGALAMGATATQCVEIANKYSTYCGMGYIVYKFGEDNGITKEEVKS